MLPKGEFHNGHNVIAFIGSYDQATHTFTKENVQLMDGGIDFYATQTTLAPDGRRIMTAWLQTWSDTEDKPQGCKWFGQTICPRELHIKDGRSVDVYKRQRVGRAGIAPCRLVVMLAALLAKARMLSSLSTVRVSSSSLQSLDRACLLYTSDPWFQAYYHLYEDRTIPDQYEQTVPQVFPNTAPGNFTWCEEMHKWVLTTFQI